MMNNKNSLANCLTRLIVCVVALVATSQHALAQGTMGTLPDPMTGRELETYAERLGLSPEQRRAVDRFYEQYHEQFRILRDGEIAEFLKAMQDMQRAGGGFPDRRQMEHFARLWESARRRIQAVDDQFFNSIQVALTDDQLAMVERLRMARERQRYRSQMGMMGMGMHVQDLSEQLLRMNLLPEERERTEPLLVIYEQQLTRSMREQSEASINMMFDMYDALEAIGFSEEALANPEQSAELMEQMQQIMADMFRRMVATTHDLRKLNYRTYQSLVHHLEEHRRRPFRDMFASGTFTELHFLTDSFAANRFEAVLSFDDLEPSLREEIQRASDAFHAERDALFTRALQFVSENPHNEMWNMFGGDEDTTYQDTLADLQQRAVDIENRASSSIAELLPMQIEQSVNERANELLQQKYAERSADESAATSFAQETVETVDASSSQDHMLPGSINSRETAIYADLLGLNEDEQMLLEELHKEYTEQFEQRTAQVMQQLMQAKHNQWQFDEQSNTAQTSTQRIAAVYDARRAAMAAITAADDAYFDDLELVLVNAPLERARSARMRSRYLAAARTAGISWGGSSGTAVVDLVDVIRLLRWEDDQHQPISDALGQWESDVNDLLAAYYDAMLAVQQASESFYATMQEMREDGDASQWQNFAERQREMLGPAQRRMSEVRSEIQQATQTAHHAIMAALSDADAAVYQQAFNHKAFPAVYRDNKAVHDQLRRALNLDDLSTSARDGLMQMNMRYNSRYHELTEAMVEIRRRDHSNVFLAMDEEAISDYMQDESEFDRLNFQRTELNDWAVRELRRLLTDEQRKLIGTLPR